MQKEKFQLYISTAISGIIILGALLQISTGGFLVELLAGVSILIATIKHKRITSPIIPLELCGS